jgi:hypothetical protein
LNASNTPVFSGTGLGPADADFQAFIAAGGPETATIAEIEKFYPNDWAYQRGWTPTKEETATYGVHWKRSTAFHTDVVKMCWQEQSPGEHREADEPGLGFVCGAYGF